MSFFLMLYVNSRTVAFHSTGEAFVAWNFKTRTNTLGSTGTGTGQFSADPFVDFLASANP